MQKKNKKKTRIKLLINKWLQNGTFDKTYWIVWISCVCTQTILSEIMGLGGLYNIWKIMGYTKRKIKKNALQIQKRRKVNQWLFTSFIYLFMCYCDSAFVASSAAPKPCCAASEWPSPQHSQGGILQTAASFLRPSSLLILTKKHWWLLERIKTNMLIALYRETPALVLLGFWDLTLSNHYLNDGYIFDLFIFQPFCFVSSLR